MTEGYIQLPADGSGKSIRLLQVVEQLADGTVVTEYQEAVTLADSDGNLLVVGGLGATSIPVSSREVVEKLDNLTKGIAHLIVLLSALGKPKGPVYIADQWVDEVLSSD
jgi:methyl coenzyme M reductase subunit C-like uncharacterized protein (methanogenesis marker protein 7)